MPPTRIKSLLQGSDEEAVSVILIVSEGVPRADELATQLVADAHVVETVAHAAQAHPAARELSPDVVVCSLDAGTGSALELCATLRGDDATARVRVVVTCGADDEAKVVECLNAGEHDVVTPPLTPAVLSARIRALLRRKGAWEETAASMSELEESYAMLEAVSEHLDEMSLQDGLTGLGNRRAMEVQLERVHSTAKRYERVYSVVLIDVDFFKKYNDHYGHQAGDDVLQAVAKGLADELREADVLFRYGGEELLALFAETDLAGAAAAAEKLRACIEGLGIEHSESPLGHLSISLGIADARPDRDNGATWEQTVERADRGLYLAKENGRNRVESVE